VTVITGEAERSESHGAIPDDFVAQAPRSDGNTASTELIRLGFRYSAARAIRSGNASDSAVRSAFKTPRSVIRPVTSRAGVTSNA